MSTKDENLLKSFLPEQFTYKFLDISYESELKHKTKFRVQEVRNEEDQCAISIFYNMNFVNCPHLNEYDKQSLFYIANGITGNLDFFMPSKRKLTDQENVAPVAEFENPQCDDANYDLESDWSDCDCDEPVSKKRKIESEIENFDSLIANSELCVETWRKIVSENTSDGFLLKNFRKFVEMGKKFQTGVQLASFLNSALERHRRGGKYISVQPMNVNRRKGKSRSRKAQRSGRPLGGTKVASKRKRDLALNISLNQLNAKSHGSGH